MTNIYVHAKICPYEKQNCNLTEEGLTFTPYIKEMMKDLSKFDKLTYVWKAWSDATGAKMKKQYEIYVDLYNEAAKANGELLI